MLLIANSLVGYEILLGRSRDRHNENQRSVWSNSKEFGLKVKK